jgi:hypothetical protein
MAATIYLHVFKGKPINRVESRLSSEIPGAEFLVVIVLLKNEVPLSKPHFIFCEINPTAD